jgi:hypothetical protein
LALGITFFAVNVCFNLLVPSFFLWIAPHIEDQALWRAHLALILCLFQELMTAMLMLIIVFVCKVAHLNQSALAYRQPEIDEHAISELN